MTIASENAFKTVLPKMSSHRTLVYSVIADLPAYPGAIPGRTMDEVAFALGWKVNRVSSRLCELADAGYVKDSGMLRSGQTVWIVADKIEKETLMDQRKKAKNGVATVQAVTDMHTSNECAVTVTMPMDKAHKLKPGCPVRLTAVR